jgi:uncharacterized protein YegL
MTVQSGSLRKKYINLTSADTADNPSPRCACVLVLDTSGSMSGRKIAELNAGLARLVRELKADDTAAKAVELAIVSFGPVELMLDFTVVHEVTPPTLSARGNTPMGKALNEALELVESRKAHYRSVGLPYYRPWVFLITDGEATDDVSLAAKRIRIAEETSKVYFVAIGVHEANEEQLASLSKEQPKMLVNTNFSELFKWISSSIRSAVAKPIVGGAP